MSLTEADAAPRAAVPDPVRRSLVTALHDLDADLFAASAVETGMALAVVGHVLAEGRDGGTQVRHGMERLGWRLGRRRAPLSTVRAAVGAVAAALDGPAGDPAGADLVRRHADVVVHAYWEGLEHQPTEPERRAARCRSLLDGGPGSGGTGTDWHVAVVSLAVPRPRLRDLAVRATTAAPAVLVTDGPGHLAALAHGGEATALLVGALGGRCGDRPDPPRITVVDAGPAPAVPAAYARCRRLDLLATLAGDDRPVVTPTSLALESILDGAPGEALARVLDRLPEALVHTLRTLYGNDLDRQATARDLHVHRNTLDYRLGRVTALIGVSPTTVRGIQLFSSALTARRIRDEGGEGP